MAFTLCPSENATVRRRRQGRRFKAPLPGSPEELQDRLRRLGGNGQRLAKQEDGYKPMKVKPKWVLVDKRNDEVVYEYHAKPRRPAHRLMVQDDPTTLGNLEYRKVSFR